MLKKLAWALVVVLLLGVSAAAAQDDRTVYWQRWDVVIDNVDTSGNQFDVTEIYDVQFTGRFTFGSAVIPTENLDRITNVGVTVDGATLSQSCSSRQATFCMSNTQDGLSISYYFPQPVTNETVHIEIAYTVSGALRIYSGGDQLWWVAIPSEHYGFPIGSSTITVQLPDGFAPREGVDPVVTYGASADVQVNGTKVVAKSTREIGGHESFEIRVQYPHDPNAAPPAWQNSFDEQRAFDENVMPLVNLGILALSLFVAIGGALFFYTLYMRKGRDPQIGPVPTYLSEPPSDLPPAIVGTLVDERADPRDAISTIIDLAHRGYLAIEESQNEGVLGFGRSSEFTFKRSDKALEGLRPFESTMMRRLFGGSTMERTMNSLRNKFYMVISEIQSDLYQELVTEKLFDTSPSTTRAVWSGIGVAIIALAVILGFVLFPLTDRYGMLLVLPPIAIGFVAVAALIVGPAMPAKTRTGAEEAAKWKAFYEYLRNMEKYSTVEEAASQFERYLPYAVAFGLDRTWINRFKNLSYVPVPYWYYPTYMGPYRRGYMAGTPMPRGVGMGDAGLPGDLARAGGGASLDQMSGGLAGGLESISSGLSNMLDSASSALTSRPQQASSGSSGSWRSGGSSWSGGGFHGGGGSGGGSRGFG
ncbi:MAG: DUF2207 domain-containing protein [Anaerolineae bacterium]